MEPWDETENRVLQEEQRQDRERALMDLRDIVEHAQRLGLPGDEVALLRWGCGITQRAR